MGGKFVNKRGVQTPLQTMASYPLAQLVVRHGSVSGKVLFNQRLLFSKHGKGKRKFKIQ